MEPSVSPSTQAGEIDLTLDHFRDLGWKPGSSNVTIRIQDGAGEGFNAPGVLGDQRRAAIQLVADIWGGFLASNVEINIDVSFDPLTCDSTGATIAQAGPQFIFESFAGAGFSNTWYPGALAEALSGQNLSLEDPPDPDEGEAQATFNEAIDNQCLGAGSRFYYGLAGGTPQGQIGFVNVALHELAHGLGFVSLVNETTGQNALGLTDIFSRHIRDNTIGLLWHQMTAPERVASAINSGNLVWDGAMANAAAADLVPPSPRLSLDSPPSIAGNYEVTTAQFGPSLTLGGVAANLAAVSDASAAPGEGCNVLTNSGELNGAIAVVDRGACDFTVKVKNAQNAGAVGVLVVNNQSGAPVPMGGTDASITIPSVMVSQEDGELIKEVLGEPEPDPEPDPDPDPEPEPEPEPEPTPDPNDPAVSFEAPSVCVEDASTLCLNGDRFRVRSSFVTSQDSGTGAAQALTDDTGFYSFFQAENVEIVVKVLDACNTTFNHFWVFAAGLTNVEVEIEVTDTQEGMILTYTNPLGRAFVPIQDTDAFATCP